MRTLSFIFSVALIAHLSAQSVVIDFRNWDDPAAFVQVKHELLETGLGEFSKDLADKNSGNTHYLAGGEYFRVSSAADYYLWYWKKFPRNFKVPYEKYANAYIGQNNLLMLSLVQMKFIGEKLPLEFEYFSNQNARFHLHREDLYFNSFIRNSLLSKNDMEIQNDFNQNSASRYRANAPVIPRSEQNGAGRPGSSDGIQRNRSSQ